MRGKSSILSSQQADSEAKSQPELFTVPQSPILKAGSNRFRMVLAIIKIRVKGLCKKKHDLCRVASFNSNDCTGSWITIQASIGLK